MDEAPAVFVEVELERLIPGAVDRRQLSRQGHLPRAEVGDIRGDVRHLLRAFEERGLLGEHGECARVLGFGLLALRDVLDDARVEALLTAQHGNDQTRPYGRSVSTQIPLLIARESVPDDSAAVADARDPRRPGTQNSAVDRPSRLARLRPRIRQYASLQSISRRSRSTMAKPSSVCSSSAPRPGDQLKTEADISPLHGPHRRYTACEGGRVTQLRGRAAGISRWTRARDRPGANGASRPAVRAPARPR